MSLTSSVEYFQNFDPKKLIKASTKEVNLETCINVVGMAKDIAPYQSGQLKNSIGYAVPGKKGGQEGEKELSFNPKEGEAAVGATAEHAIYQEFGTRNTAPHPFLRPAVDRFVNESSLGSVMKKVVEETARGPLGRKGRMMETFT